MKIYESYWLNTVIVIMVTMMEILSKLQYFQQPVLEFFAWNSLSINLTISENLCSELTGNPSSV